MKTKFTFLAAKTTLLLILVLSLSNCRKNHDGCPETTIDSTHFDSSELAKIPDWKGDSLFFYSNAGDTAYMVCTVQYGGYELESGGSGYNIECSRSRFSYYPEYNYKYISNHPDLNGIRVVIYKESNAYQFEPGPPLAKLFIEPKVTNQYFSRIGGNVISNDSALLANGQYAKGWFTLDSTVSVSLKIGIIKFDAIFRNGNRWTLFYYNLNN